MLVLYPKPLWKVIFQCQSICQLKEETNVASMQSTTTFALSNSCCQNWINCGIYLEGLHKRRSKVDGLFLHIQGQLKGSSRTFSTTWKIVNDLWISIATCLRSKFA